MELKSMLKRGVALAMSMSLVISSAMTSFASTGRELTQDELATIFDDSIIMAEAWKSVGFTSDQIKDVLSLKRNENIEIASASELRTLGVEMEGDEPIVSSLSEETEETIKFEEQLQNSISNASGARAANGNPPEDAQEQAERIKYVYQDFYQLYAGQQVSPRYIAYLYLSHYVDNPNYDRTSPNFDAIYADVLTSEDISAYDNFINGTIFQGLSNDIVHFSNAAYDLMSISADAPEKLSNAFEKGRVISLNTVATALSDFCSSIEDLKDINKAIIDGMQKKYSTAANADQIIDTITKSIEDPVKDATRNYIVLCVTGLVSVLTATPALAGLSISLSVFYYDVYSSLMNRARLAALQYSYHGRLALRIEKVLYG